jgi:hypothetical protein
MEFEVEKGRLIVAILIYETPATDISFNSIGDAR